MRLGQRAVTGVTGSWMPGDSKVHICALITETQNGTGRKGPQGS